MASASGQTASESSFPFVGVGVAVLLLHTVLIATLPPNPYRSAVTIAALFMTGYCALAIIAGTSVRLSWAETLAFTVGLTILLTSLSAILVSIVGVSITDSAITMIGLPITVAAWLLRGWRSSPRRALSRGMRTLFDFGDYSRSEKAIAGILLAGIAVALAAFILLAGVFYPGRLSPALALVGPDGTPASLPTAFAQGVPQTITLTALGGSQGGAFVVRIQLVPMNATGNESFHPVPLGPPLALDPFAEYTSNITLVASGTWTQPLSVAIEAAGNYTIRFDLIDATPAVVASSTLPVVVS